MNEQKKIVVLGAGESGVGAAVLAQKKGFDVFVSDSSPIKESYRSMLIQTGIEYEEGHHSEERILSADEIIKSPGIPNDAPMIIQLTEKGIPVISEIEFAGRYTDAKMICITGSNGKTTTTMLTYHLLSSAGLNVGLQGTWARAWPCRWQRESMTATSLNSRVFSWTTCTTSKQTLPSC